MNLVKSFSDGFTSMFRVIVLLHPPASTRLGMMDRHLDIALENIFVNLGVHFPLHDGKRSIP